MKTTLYFLKPFLLICTVMFTSCDDFVEVDRPNSQLTTDAVFEDATTANAVMVDVYSQMRENGFASGRPFGLSCLMGVYADELTSYQNGAYSTAGFYNNSLLASDDYVMLLWNGSYNQIYACNAIIEGVARSISLPAIAKSQLQGEALFARSFVYLNLINTFGDVPFIITTDYMKNSTVSRTPTETIYQNIISDLEAAIGLLPETYLTEDRTRPNKATVRALLARVYLYHGDYAEAANMASSVLNDEVQYSWVNDLDSTFLIGSTATIWQLASGSQGSNANEGATFIFFSGPPSIVSLSDNLVGDFEPGDLRKQHWIKEVTDGTTSWYHAYKYKQDAPTGSSTEYSVQLRIAEQYMIRAEARCRQGELIGAKEDLNFIRSKAGLLDSPAVTQDELLAAILLERRHELFTEYGHRFFDLKRFGKLNDILGAKPGWAASDQLWPIPQTELLLNPFLAPQNPGY